MLGMEVAKRKGKEGREGMSCEAGQSRCRLWRPSIFSSGKWDVLLGSYWFLCCSWCAMDSIGNVNSLIASGLALLARLALLASVASGAFGVFAATATCCARS